MDLITEMNALGANTHEAVERCLNKPELYENDVIEKVSKRKKNDIWTRGGEKRTRFKDE